MWSVHLRLGELWFRHSNGEGLDDIEMEELKLCLDANMKKVQKLARLHNLSLIASMTNDTDWQHQICAKIDRLKEQMIV